MDELKQMTDNMGRQIKDRDVDQKNHEAELISYIEELEENQDYNADMIENQEQKINDLEEEVEELKAKIADQAGKLRKAEQELLSLKVTMPVGKENRGP